MKKVQENKKPRSGGRPSQGEAELINDRILDAAKALFFTQGYGITSIEAIVASAQISKRTFYHRFTDKADVFRAVVNRVVNTIQPPNMQALFEGKNIEDILLKLATAALRAVLTPEALALHRLILSEAGRFPELALAANGQGARQAAVRHIAALLQKEVEAGRLMLHKPEFAGEQFFQMVVALPQRRAMGLGKPMTARELEQWVQDTVHLFLNGCRLSTKN